MLGVQTEREWRAFCITVLQQPCLATDPRFASNAQRVAQQTALQSLIDAVFGQLTANEVLGRLDQAGIANARVNDMQVLWHHPQLQARHRLTTVDTPAGPVAALRPPASHSGHAPRMAAVAGTGRTHRGHPGASWATRHSGVRSCAPMAWSEPADAAAYWAIASMAMSMRTSSPT